jgi:DNA-binding NtrC family response regulator
MRKGISALFVAENEFIHEYFQTVWGTAFRQFRAERSARGALLAMLKGNYDAVFINEYLPDGNPLELLPMIKGTSPGAKVIFLITHKCDGARLCSRYGAWRTLSKPFSSKEVRCVLDGLPCFSPPWG